MCDTVFSRSVCCFCAWAMQRDKFCCSFRRALYSIRSDLLFWSFTSIRIRATSPKHRSALLNGEWIWQTLFDFRFPSSRSSTAGYICISWRWYALKMPYHFAFLCDGQKRKSPFLNGIFFEYFCSNRVWLRGRQHHFKYLSEFFIGPH